MGILDRLLPTRTTTTTSGADYTSSIANYGSAALNRVGQYYKENPRKVQLLGLIAGAALLARMKRGR